MTRNNLLETMGETTSTARAKGLSERQLSSSTAFARADAIVTMFGLDIALLVGGAVITSRSSTCKARTWHQQRLQQDLRSSLGVGLVGVRSRSQNLLVVSSTRHRPAGRKRELARPVLLEVKAHSSLTDGLKRRAVRQR